LALGLKLPHWKCHPCTTTKRKAGEKKMVEFREGLLQGLEGVVHLFSYPAERFSQEVFDRRVELQPGAKIAIADLSQLSTDSQSMATVAALMAQISQGYHGKEILLVMDPICGIRTRLEALHPITGLVYDSQEEAVGKARTILGI